MYFSYGNTWWFMRKEVLLQQQAHPASRKISALRVSLIFLDMSKVPFTKQNLSFSGQVQLLKKRGLLIADETAAEAWLRSVSYYRMSGYWYPLLADRENHIFKPNATFEQACRIYNFDLRLRQLVFSQIGRLEIAVRTQMSYVMSITYGGHWFEDVKLFANSTQHAKTLQNITDEYLRSDEQFVRAFRNKYSDPLPPSWMTLEVTSFGTISILYQNLKPGLLKRKVAAAFGVSDTVFSSWLHSLAYVRNLCAHHARLWNRTLGVRPLMPRHPKQLFISQPISGTQHVYFILSIIRYWLNAIDPSNNFADELKSLLNGDPTVDPRAMGFPIGWQQEPLWK